MTIVIFETDPAELVTALAAGHVHAALVLLDRSFALWAVFGVQLDPGGQVVRAVHAVLPLLEEAAVDWRVGFVAALETELGFALSALNVTDCVACLLFDKAFTARALAVFEQALLSLDKFRHREALVLAVKLFF